jgi:hypothetical protein
MHLDPQNLEVHAVVDGDEEKVKGCLYQRDGAAAFSAIVDRHAKS